MLKVWILREGTFIEPEKGEKTYINEPWYNWKTQKSA